jgi:hypothetical protein
MLIADISCEKWKAAKAALPGPESALAEHDAIPGTARREPGTHGMTQLRSALRDLREWKKTKSA